MERYLGIGALVGAAAGGVNTAAVIGLIPPFFASIFRRGAAGRERFEIKKLAFFFFSFAAVALIFVALYPYGFTRAEGAVNPEMDVVGRFSLLFQKSLVELVNFWGIYARALWNFETPLFLVGLLGLGFYLWRGRRFWALTMFTYAFSFFTLLYLFDDYTVRGIIFVIPLLAVFAGYASDAALQKIEELYAGRSRAIFFVFCIALFVLFFGWQLVTDLRYDWLLAQDDTRLVAAKWIDGHLPAGSKIIMDSQSMRLTNTKDGIRELRAMDPSALRAADEALLSLPDDRYPTPAYGVVNINFVSLETRAAFSADLFHKQGFKYLVVEYGNSSRIAEDTGRLVSGAKLLQHFSQWKDSHSQAFDGSGKLGRLSISDLFRMRRFGLFVDIYEL